MVGLQLCGEAERSWQAPSLLPDQRMPEVAVGANGQSQALGQTASPRDGVKASCGATWSWGAAGAQRTGGSHELHGEAEPDTGPFSSGKLTRDWRGWNSQVGGPSHLGEKRLSHLCLLPAKEVGGLAGA